MHASEFIWFIWFCISPARPRSKASELLLQTVSAALRDTVTSYIIVHHTAVHSSNHHILHPSTDFEPDWMSLKPSNLGSRSTV